MVRTGGPGRGCGTGGFSMLEIVVVMVIGAVLVAVALPNFNKLMTRHQLDTAARQLAADLREARERAQTERTPYEVKFFKEADRYVIRKYVQGQGFYLVHSVELPPRVDMFYAKFFGQVQDHVLWFNSFGEPSGAAANGAVGLKTRAGGELRYVIISKTGRVRVSDQPPD
ncbi:MAG: prepilin-type N-terminal cleavage/methylation domain-containing protein [Candidatus Desulforudis sp.]|nr:prepilin-type N-terminal cleavage/methylation domain-containing protein [Desulforudis sp.]